MAIRANARVRGMNAALDSGEAGVGELAPARGPLHPRQAAIMLLAATVGSVAGVVTFHSAVSAATRFSGQVVPAHAYYLNFAAAGPVLALNVQPGAQVTAGQVLATESSTVAQANLTAAQAAVTADQAAVAEAESQNPAALEQARSQLAAAQAEVVTDQQAQADTSIVAPASGYVAGTGGAVGDVDSPQGVHNFNSPAGQSGADQNQQPGFQLFEPGSNPGGGSSGATSAYNALITLYTDPLRVVAQVPEKDIQGIEKGQSATMSIGAAGLIVPGTVSEIELDPADVPGVIDYDVVISMNSVPTQVLAGMSVNVAVN
jgi:multidrug efflux pump subunit AcrA (membrane-fusion protein)